MSNIKILSSINDEERILTRHIIDLAKQSETSGRFRASCFLDERQLVVCTAMLSKEGFDNYYLSGGYDDAVRRVIIFRGYGEHQPFTPVVFNYRHADKPSHRDFLGALMSLDIKREMIGDILVGNGRTVVFILNAILPMVAEMSKVGRFGVSISYDFSPDDIPAQEFDVINATVQSLRLDSVLSSAINHSREKTQKLIKSNGVVLNHVMTYEPSEKMSEGDIFSVRGIGKFVLSGVGGLSKKDRIFITINKYK